MMNEIKIDDIIAVPFGLYFKYSDIVESSKEKNEENRFLVKKLTKDGIFTGYYCNTCDAVFREKEIKPYAKKFNPEKLI